MPYKSDAQRRYFNANRKKLQAQGVDVDEWNEASRGKKLPEKVKTAGVGSKLMGWFSGLGPGKQLGVALGGSAAAAGTAGLGGYLLSKGDKPAAQAAPAPAPAAAAPASPASPAKPLDPITPSKVEPGIGGQLGNAVWHDRSLVERGLMYGLPAGLLAMYAVMRARRSKPRDKYKYVIAADDLLFRRIEAQVLKLAAEQPGVFAATQAELIKRARAIQGKTEFGTKFKSRTVHADIGEKSKVDMDALRKAGEHAGGNDDDDHVPTSGPQSFSGSTSGGLGFMAGSLGY